MRARAYTALGLSGLVPAAHYYLAPCILGDDVQAPRDHEVRAVLWPYLVATLVASLVGVGIYITRVPECHWPGSFDLIGQSHNFWHVFVLMAVLSFVEGCLG